MSPRAAAIRAARPRGIYVPAEEVEGFLACGWRLIDDCPGSDRVLMAPPERQQEAA